MTEFARFHNALRIMRNIDAADFISHGGKTVEWEWFASSPYDWFIRASDDSARKLWDLIESRQPVAPPRHIDLADKLGRQPEDPTAPITDAERAAVDADPELSAWVVSAYYSDEFSNTTVGDMRAMVRAKLREKAKAGPVTGFIKVFTDHDDGSFPFCLHGIASEPTPPGERGAGEIANVRVTFRRGQFDTADTPSEWDQAIDAALEHLRVSMPGRYSDQQIWAECAAIIKRVKDQRP